MSAGTHEARDALLLVLARNENVLAPASWEEIAATLREWLGCARAGVTLRDGPEHYRIYALCRGPGYDFAPFQQRLPVLPHTDEIVYQRGEPYLCDDTRTASIVEQMFAQAGYLSYALIPMKGPEGVFGDVIFAFTEERASRAASPELYVAFAAALAEAMPRAVASMRVHRLAHILDCGDDALVAWDVLGCVTDVNPAAERLTGRARGSLIGRPVEQILGPEPLSPSPPGGMRRALSRADGSDLVVNATLAREATDPLVAGYAILRDLTQVVLAEQRLVQSDRLATLGMLAAGVAHEINNPAAFILLGLELVERRLRAARTAGTQIAELEIDGLLGDLRESTERIVTIARDLRHFATPGGGGPVLVDVRRAVESALTLVRAQVLERADLDVQIEADLPAVLLEEGRLAQVIVNLLVNAVQAVPKGLARAVVRIEARSSEGIVRVDVADSGDGVAPEDFERIWAPFFTTKPAGQGTGLGLSISRGIVERAGGTVHLESPSGIEGGGRGARFVVLLPAAHADLPPSPSSSPPAREASRRYTLLLVEDEAALARALLEHLGTQYDVTLVARGDDAVRVLAGRKFDVVLCDLRMPGLSGEAVYQRVVARDPAQASRFIFMTGVGFGEDTERFLAAASVPLLEKPFAMEDAQRVIAKVGAGQR